MVAKTTRNVDTTRWKRLTYTTGPLLVLTPKQPKRCIVLPNVCILYSYILLVNNTNHTNLYHPIDPLTMLVPSLILTDFLQNQSPLRPGTRAIPPSPPWPIREFVSVVVTKTKIIRRYIYIYISYIYIYTYHIYIYISYIYIHIIYIYTYIHIIYIYTYYILYILCFIYIIINIYIYHVYIYISYIYIYIHIYHIVYIYIYYIVYIYYTTYVYHMLYIIYIYK